jgi:aminoglycoside phosphotransferase
MCISRINPASDVDLEKCEKLGVMPKFSSVYKLTDGTILKTGPSVRPSEAATMKYIRDKTSIPVPRVIDLYVDHRTGYWCIQMEYIEGRLLEIEYESFDKGAKAHIVAQLRDYLHQLRRLPRKASIAAFGGPARDQFLQLSQGQPPHVTEEEFLHMIANTLERRGGSWARTVALVLRDESNFTGNSSQDGFVMTHGSLTPRHIMVDGSTIVGIIDWSQAGHYPDYWEYVKAYMHWNVDSRFLKDGVPDRILDKTYNQELDIVLCARDIIW